MSPTPLRILFAASEMAPYAKTGGLGDVMGSLPDKLARGGDEVHVIMPLYRQVRAVTSGLRAQKDSLWIWLNDQQLQVPLFTLRRASGVTMWFIDIPRFYDREDFYGAHNEIYLDSAARFTALSLCAVELARQLKPHIIHSHDWFTALCGVFLKEHAWKKGELTDTRSVFTIHNLAFQGVFDFYEWPLLNLPYEQFNSHALEYYGQINFLKGGIVWADAVTTVSPSYAQEILTLAQGFGLSGVLSEYRAKLTGIVNGIDTEVWNPADNSLLPHTYSPRAMEGKAKNREELARRCGFSLGPDTRILGVISRLTEQKGWPLIREAFDRLMQRDVALAVLGGGDPDLEAWLLGRQEQYRGRMSVTIGFNEGLAHLIEAGSDFYLMPSQFEPCGLNQLYSIRYGTPPIVHAIGGLKDTVIDMEADDKNGNGFLFQRHEPGAFLEAVDRALRFERENPKAFLRLKLKAMEQDVGWDESAANYRRLYVNLTGGR